MAVAFDKNGSMYRGTVQIDGGAASGISIAIAIAIPIILIFGLAGCAATPYGSDSEASPYVGVFTGEYVDGKPLYRFPPILVVGSRSGVDGL